jgi:hypothetical protein
VEDVDLTDPALHFYDDAPPAATPRTYPASWQIINDVALMALPDPQWIIEGVLGERSMGALYAPPGLGKTTLLASMFVSIGANRDWFGHHVTRPGSCLYVAAEDPAGFKVRLRAAKRAARLPLDQSINIYTFPDALDLRDPVNVVSFRNFVNAQTWPEPLRVIGFDTYAANMPGAAENSSEDVTTAMVAAQALRNSLDVTVCFVHHTNAAQSRERGHSAMRGAADFMLAMHASDDVITLEASKQRQAESGREVCTLKLVPAPDGAGCVFRLAKDVLASAGMTAAQSKIFAVLRDSFGIEGATKTEWLKCCNDVADRTFYHAANKLVEHGHVRAIGTHFRVTDRSAT